MELQKEAQRIMTMSVWKMYHSRMQRGGLRLHRSLQLSLVMRNARDLYLSAKLEEEEEMGGGGGGATAEDLAGRETPLSAQGEAPCPPYLELPPPTPYPQAHQEVPPASPTPALRCPSPDPEPMETQEGPNDGSPAPPASPPPPTAWSRSAPPRPPGAAKPSRKRRSSSLGKMGAAEAGLVPSKKAKLVEEEGERQPQRQEGPFPSLARVLQDRFSGLILPSSPPPPPLPAKGSDEPKASCRQGDGGGGVLSIMVRAVVAF
ncbi:hypothetical protein JRQ81_002380 [Phrynocephalus forsythii]|uniref:Immediate early response 2 n=1 Tax=Phrynocephalus forsythii TaxID=171643 RepID=A0A9Q0XHU9_9SAUR|nr:hypothetical protein JRQ81_002380 [Phrynocephalus forsythii]